MFLENDYAIPLFDTINGGGPRAFECKHLTQVDPYKAPEVGQEYKLCGKLCRTEQDMKRHLKQTHGIEVQGCLFSMEPQSPPSLNEPRKLRVSPSLKENFKGQNVLPYNSKPSPVENPESSIAANENGAESLKPISEEILSESAQLNQNSPTTVPTDKEWQQP